MMEKASEIEKLAKEIYAECQKEGEPVTGFEALEMAEMELNAKKNCKHYEKSEKATKEKKAVKERKIDYEKKSILELIKTVFTDENITITNEKTETELSFLVGENSYTLKLTKHRKGKA